LQHLKAHRQEHGSERKRHLRLKGYLLFSKGNIGDKSQLQTGNQFAEMKASLCDFIIAVTDIGNHNIF
jgi:hypothetical protein